MIEIGHDSSYESSCDGFGICSRSKVCKPGVRIFRENIFSPTNAITPTQNGNIFAIIATISPPKLTKFQKCATTHQTGVSILRENIFSLTNAITPLQSRCSPSEISETLKNQISQNRQKNSMGLHFNARCPNEWSN